MSDSVSTSCEQTVTVSGRDPLQLASNLILALDTLTRGSAQRDEPSDAGTVVPFQAEAISLPDLAQRMVEAVQAAIVDSSTEVDELELANVLATDGGWRAWGYLRFGSTPRAGRPATISIAPTGGSTSHGQAEFHLIVNSATPTPTHAHVSGAADSGVQ